MHLFGNSSRAAIGFTLDSDPQGEWLFGRCSFILGGISIGDDQQTTSLRDVLFELDELAKYAGGKPRASKSLQGLPSTELFKRLDAVFYGDANATERQLAEEEHWAKHMILPRVDVLDAVRAYLVESADVGRIVYRHAGAEPRELVLAPREFDQTLDQARTALDAAYCEALAKSSSPTSP